MICLKKPIMILKSIRIFFMLIIVSIAGFAQKSPIIIPTSHSDKILNIVLDRQNKYFYTGDDWKIIMWDFKTMTQLHTFEVANKLLKIGYSKKATNYKNLTVSPDGNIIAFASENKVLKIYSTVTGKIIRDIPSVNSKFIFSKNSKIIYYLQEGKSDRMIKSIDIANGIVSDYWELSGLTIPGVYNSYFYPLTDARILNFTASGYQILDIESKKEIGDFKIPEEDRKKYTDEKKPFYENFFNVLAEPGLFVFEQYKKGGKEEFGYTSWDIFNNKEFAFIPAYAQITFQENYNAQNLLYITKDDRYNKQEVVIYSSGNKIEKKKKLNDGDEMSIAALSKNKNIIIYADFNQNLGVLNLDNTQKRIVAKGFPKIDKTFFYRDANSLSLNGKKPTLNPKDTYATYENYNADYVINLDNASVQLYDTLPLKPLSNMGAVKLSNNNFILNYELFNSDVHQYFFYDKNLRKTTPFVVKDFILIAGFKGNLWPKLPSIFTLNNSNELYYSVGSFDVKKPDDYYYYLYKYNLVTKQSQQIIKSATMSNEKWESLGGTSKNQPYAATQLLIDKESEILVSAEYDYKGTINIIDMKTGKTLARHPFNFDSIALKNNINKQDFQNIGNSYRPFNLLQVKRLKNNVVRVLGSEFLYDFNMDDNSVKERKIIDGKMFDNKYQVKIFGDNAMENVFVSYEDENTSVIKSVFGPNNVSLDHFTSTLIQLEFTQNDSVIYTIHDDNSINVYNAITGAYYGTLYTFEDSKDWVFVGADGRFDGTDKGIAKLYYLNNRDVVSIDKVYEKYFTPNLYQRLLAGEKFEPIPNIQFKPKPKTKILYAEKQRNLEVEDDVANYANTTGIAEITVSATAPEDKVDEIRLFHNGKVVNLATRGLFVTDNDGSESKKYTINLLPGNNNFRAIALNSQRTESDADEIFVNYNTTADNSPVTVKPVNNSTAIISTVNKDATLHLIVVGINEYQNKTMSLNYAMADATSFKEEVEKDAKTILGNIKTYFVTNNTADKTGITNAFKQVQQNAKAQDVFIFYYAGHGVIGKDKEFYLVPTDVSDLKNVQTELEQKGIASKLLQQYAVDIQAQKQLFILDACQSAGAFEKLLSNDGDQQKSIAVVSRSTGTHWMAASGAMQYANEFSSLGHGAFTYVLLQALKGEAAANKMITVNGLKSFLQVQVPLLMKKYNGSAQYPASYGFGNDFPVEIVK